MSAVRKALRGWGEPPLRSAGGRATAAERSRTFTWLVRIGFLSRGLTYGLVGALALALASGAGTDGARPNQQGALTLVAQAPLGKVVLIVIALGLMAYAIWKLAQGLRGRGPEGGADPSLHERVGDVGGGVGYLMFFALALRVLVGSAGNSSQAPRHTAAGVLGWPGGQWLVGAAGLAMIAVSIYQAYDALSAGFVSDSRTAEMSRRERHSFIVLGRIGLTSRALVFALIGYFVLRTALAFNPNNAVGVDGALARLHHQPLGPWLVGAVGVGLIIFALYTGLEARYRRL